MFFNDNIRFLRKRAGRTQDDVASALSMKRSTLSGYENSVAQPALETLIAFSKYFNIAVDTLLKIELSKLPESQLSQLEKGFDVFLRGGNLRVLATTVGTDNEENIELVSHKARAGYTSGYADPEYISVLPAFRLPFLSKQKKYRTFQISGDSMLPIPDGSWVTGVFVQDWTGIRDKDACIILTADEGIVFKVVENKIRTEGKLRLHSLNPDYEPYEIGVKDIREVWQFIHYISSDLPSNETSDRVHLAQTVKQLREEVRAIQTRLELL